jgi:hypothetical protein
MWQWVNFFHAAVETIFGANAPLLECLRFTRDLAGAQTNFKCHTPADWRAYFWRCHIAVRDHFHPHKRRDERMMAMNDLLACMRFGRVIMEREVPPELRHQTQTEKGKSKQKDKHNAGGADRDNDDRPRNARNFAKKFASDCARATASSIDKAKEAVQTAGKVWHLPLLFPEGCAQMLGDAAAGVPNPCPRLCAHGKCTVQKCKQSHNLANEPSRQQAQTFIGRIKDRCKEIAANPGNA